MRVLGYTRPHRRLLIPAVFCIVIVAISFSAGIAAILPVMQAIVSPDEGLPTWANRAVTAKRLNADLTTLICDESDTTLRRFDRCLMVTRVEATSPLAAVVDKDSLPLLIVSQDGTPVSSAALLRTLSHAPVDADLTLGIISRKNASTGGEPRSATIRLTRKPDVLWRAGLWAADLMPPGRTREEKLYTLAVVLGVMFAINLVGGLARFGGEYLIALVAGRSLVGMRRQMYRKLLRLPVSFFAQRGTSDVISRFVQDSQDIYRGLTYIFVQSIREPLKAMGTFAVALYVDWRITLLTVIAAPGAILVIRSFGRSIRKRSRRLLQGYGRMLTALEGALIGIRVVKAYGSESYERRHLYQTDWHMFRQQAGIERIEALTSPLFECIGYLLGALASLYFADLVITNRLDPGDFILIIVCLAAMFDPVRKLSGFYNRIERANAAAERIFEVIDMPDETSGTPGRRLPALREAIEFRDVSFTYPEANRPAVAGVSFAVRRGERVAVVGPNGSGKTTLVSLLMRFFEPQSGAILFDGMDVRSGSLASLRDQIGLVTQESVVFGDSVRSNIAYGNPRLLWKLNVRQRHPERRFGGPDPNEQITAAARAAYADEFISQLPQKYDTIIGEHGATLSGGQRQRLAIARAILANCPILIFDEATSQIDSDSEQKIHDALERFLKDRTAFIIAHRFSTILQADRIIVMDQGRIVDSGRHEELLPRCRLYRTLFEAQLQPSES